MKKKVLSVFFAALMFMLMLPVQALASGDLQGDTNRNGTVEVYMTISEGTDGFYIPENGKALFHAEMNIPYFDIALYGLEGYYYNPDCYSGSTQQPGTKETAEGVVTSMHAFIYATEKYMLDVPEADLGTGKHNEDLFEYISWTQGAGSSFMKFWNGDTNLNYYLDYMFPLGKEGWGSTSDQQALSDGSKIDVHLIIDQDVMGSSYSCFRTEDGTFDTAEITESESLVLTLQRTLSSYDSTETFSILPGVETFYIPAEEYAGQEVSEDYWAKLGTTDENGQITVPSDLAAGTYYISCLGEIIESSSERGPAAFILTVNEAKSDENITYGDVNGDGKIEAYDASLILQYVVTKIGDNDIVTNAADVDGNGKIEAYDASLILQYVVEKITVFPAEQ